MNKLSKLPEWVNIPQEECFFRSQNSEKGMISMEIVLFWWDTFWVNHEWYIPYLIARIDWFEENIWSNPIRYQGLVNCLTKSLMPYGQSKSETQLEINFDQFIWELELLYGYLWDMPELLEKKWKWSKNQESLARDTTIENLINNWVIKKRNEELQVQWEEFTQLLISIIEFELDSDQRDYIEGCYSRSRNPKEEELRALWVSEEIISKIILHWGFLHIQSVIGGAEMLIWEKQWFKLYELSTLQHLWWESNATWHCIWDSDHYIDKINSWKVRIFSLRTDSSSPITCEYMVWENHFREISRNFYSRIKFEELKVILTLVWENLWISHPSFLSTDIGNPTATNSYIFEYDDVENVLKRTQYKWNKISKKTISGRIVCNSSTTLEELEIISNKNIDIDATHVNPAVKNQLTTVKWSLIDNSQYDTFYENLESIGWDFKKTSHTWGRLISAPKLRKVGRNLEFESVEYFDFPQLTEVWGALSLQSATSAIFHSLRRVWWYIGVSNAKQFIAMKLEYVWTYIDAPLAERVCLLELKKCHSLTVNRLSRVEISEWNMFEIKYENLDE